MTVAQHLPQAIVVALLPFYGRLRFSARYQRFVGCAGLDVWFPDAVFSTDWCTTVDGLPLLQPPRWIGDRIVKEFLLRKYDYGGFLVVKVNVRTTNYGSNGGMHTHVANRGQIFYRNEYVDQQCYYYG